VIVLEKFLMRFQIQAWKPVDTPIKKGSTLSISMCPQTSEEKEKMTRIFYSNVVGSLMYAMMCTRPDICHAVGLVSQFQANLGFAHCKAVKQIFRYLKGTIDYMLCYQASDPHLVGYSDVVWGGGPD